ncbi:MAG: ion transporter [Lachnospiraceae bacterium]|nr:ion transporter [Lachnospiraceae bacterium]
MRKRLYEIIEVAKEGDVVSTVYDVLMLCTIVISVIPLAFKSTNIVFQYMDAVSTVIFIIDYLFRWGTADYKLGRKSVVSFLKYPLTPWALIDLISILPGITILNNGFRLFRLFRIFRTFRVFKAFRYSKSIIIIVQVIRKSKDALMAVCTLALGYIVVSALIVFNVEGDSFGTFFDAIYWATVSLTTVGYGDIYPVTTAGRIITMISSIFGIAIVALPAGIITAGYMDALNEEKDSKAKTDSDDQNG